MIDIENEVFNTVANVLRASYPGITIDGIPTETPASFPYVSLVEDDNTEITGNVTLTHDTETASNLMYTANVYSNSQSGKKAQAKAIMDVVDTQMRSMGFIRTMRSQLPNVDRTIYRVTARYSRIIQNF